MEWHTKEKAETSPEFGTIPEKRDIEKLLKQSFILIDKPKGPTSNQVTSWIKKELNLKKTGHFGTLDPHAHGILPIGLNQGTRISQTLSKTDKTYIFEAKLREKQKTTEEDIRETLQTFKGTNKQTPPKKSAVKREERERKVYEVKLLEKNQDKILGKVHCESGFYVRTLITQLAEKLNTEGEMTELRRTQQGPFKENQTHTIQDIVDAYHYHKQEQNSNQLREILQPIEKATQQIPKIAVKDSAVNAIANGAQLGAQGISKHQHPIQKNDTVAITTLKGELIALAKAQMTSEEMYDAKEGTAAKLKNVYMNPQTYPKRWKQD